MKQSKPLTRLYFSGLAAHRGRCETSAAQMHHLTRVLRLEPGDSLTVFDGTGREFAAVIHGRGASGLVLELGAEHAVDRESPVGVTLAQGISSGDRMDYTLQKAVELGVVAIQPLAMVRSVVQLTGERAAKRVAHWQAVVISACEQCGRTRVPEVAPIQSITTWLASQRAVAGGQVRLLLTPRAGQRLHDLPRSTEVTLLAGPEGGLAPEEEAQALAAGFTGVRLGPRVLRTETAALAAIAALQTLWGDF